MTKKKKKMVKGFRPGMTKEEIIPHLTKEDWARINHWKEIEERFIDDDDAFKCAVRTDQFYQQWDEKIGVAQGEVFNILSLKSKYDKNKEQIDRKEIIEMYPSSTMFMSERDMEINNLMNQQRMGESIRKLWLILADLYRYVEQLRLDKKIFFTKKQYSAFVKGIKDELAKQGIDLYKERV